MSHVWNNSVGRGTARAALLLGLALVLALPAMSADKKKKDAPAPKPKATILERLDYSKIVWPNPPAITRIKYLDYFAGEKFQPNTKQQKPKVGWMDRLAGVATGEAPSDKLRFQLVTPYGVAVDSKGRLYVADSKVLGVFIFDTQNKGLELIKNGVHARFGWIVGLAMDDADQLYVSDPKMKRIVVFNPQHAAIGSISEGLVSPGGMAVDNENRFLYAADAELDQVLVFDADPPFKLLRKIGTTGKDHSLTAPGEFARPSNVAVDRDGNLYVTDTLNNRVEIFDAEGKFIREFGKAGDTPGYFARPKGIAVDGDGHVWVADAVQDRVQVFSPEGRLLIYMGEHGILPGQFRSLAGITIDKQNRVFTSEQYPGRVQMFRYITDAEALAEKEKREAEKQKKTSGGQGAVPAPQGTGSGNQ